jgi:hypothetical protein
MLQDLFPILMVNLSIFFFKLTDVAHRFFKPRKQGLIRDKTKAFWMIKIELVWDARMVIRSLGLRANSMLVMRFGVDSELSAEDWGKDEEENDAVRY